MTASLYADIAKLKRIGDAICNQRRMAPRQPIAPVQPQTPHIALIIDMKRPVTRHTVGTVPGCTVSVLAQEGLTGTWYAWTEERHPCPGNQPVRLQGAAKTEELAVAEVAANVELLNRMGYFGISWADKEEN